MTATAHRLSIFFVHEWNQVAASFKADIKPSSASSIDLMIVVVVRSRRFDTDIRESELLQFAVSGLTAS
jgi:hypothetical protein